MIDHLEVKMTNTYLKFKMNFWLPSIFSSVDKLGVYMIRNIFFFFFQFILLFVSFSHQILTGDFFHWNLSDSKSLQLPRTLLSILLISTVLQFEQYQVILSLSLFSRFSKIVLSAITISLFHNFFSYLARCRY